LLDIGSGGMDFSGNVHLVGTVTAAERNGSMASVKKKRKAKINKHKRKKRRRQNRHKKRLMYKS
jgi:hypothetical protein